MSSKRLRALPALGLAGNYTDREGLQWHASSALRPHGAFSVPCESVHSCPDAAFSSKGLCTCMLLRLLLGATTRGMLLAGASCTGSALSLSCSRLAVLLAFQKQKAAAALPVTSTSSPVVTPATAGGLRLC